MMMTTEISPDVDLLFKGPIQTIAALQRKQRKVTEALEVLAITVSKLSTLFIELEKLDVTIQFHPEYEAAEPPGSIDLLFAGDGPKLAKVWRLLRLHGYNTLSRPKKGDTTFSAFWRPNVTVQYSPIWMQFSSTLCRRVKVGTKMQEVDIYETQCEGTDLSKLQLQPKQIAQDSNIPF
jgi:hypothetical protein